WDSYPMGFLLDRVPEGDQGTYLRQGDPDFQAFHHDLYRAVGQGRWWVMEQQPGPVNWATWNPAPLPGMVRLWSWEAFAHGAEAVCWFRWRQAPFAQEQQHAGLRHSDDSPAMGWSEAEAVARELAEAPDVSEGTAPVAMVFDYTSQWAWEAQPQGADFDYFALCFALYRACRSLGLSVDILSPDTGDLGDRKLTLVPGLLSLSPSLRAAIKAAPGVVVTGPRTDLKTHDLGTKLPLGPDLPGLTLRSAMQETLPPTGARPLERGGTVTRWLEHVTSDYGVVERTADGTPILLRDGKRFHLAGWPDAEAARRILRDLAHAAKIPTQTLPDGVRIRDTGSERFIFNYSPQAQPFQGGTIPAAGVIRQARS
ncbi:MAG: beta-galactosidase, partial [Pseudomonadota bacterium]